MVVDGTNRYEGGSVWPEFETRQGGWNSDMIRIHGYMATVFWGGGGRELSVDMATVFCVATIYHIRQYPVVGADLK